MSFFRGDALAYYFDVNTKYALNKLRLLLCPFIHQGSWTRLRDQVEGRFAYKPPRHDVNAPDLYIPCTTMYLYVVACCGGHLGLLRDTGLGGAVHGRLPRENPQTHPLLPAPVQHVRHEQVQLRPAPHRGGPDPDAVAP